MKKIILFLIISITAGAAHAQYIPVEQGSALKFTIANLGFDVNGTFSGFKGSINFDPQNLTNGSFDVSINAATVNTDNSLRDSHLKDGAYFDVSNYPRIHFVSGKISGKNGSYILTGQLTIKDKTKPVTFPFTALPTNDGYIFKGSFKIKRKDFGIGGFSTIADELEVNLIVHAVKA